MIAVLIWRAEFISLLFIPVEFIPPFEFIPLPSEFIPVPFIPLLPAPVPELPVPLEAPVPHAAPPPQHLLRLRLQQQSLLLPNPLPGQQSQQ